MTRSKSLNHPIRGDSAFSIDVRALSNLLARVFVFYYHSQQSWSYSLIPHRSPQIPLLHLHQSHSKMHPPHSFALALETIYVANLRILPTLLRPPSLAMFYDTLIALNPLVTSFWLAHVQILLQLLLSLFTRSFSWNDRLWSLIPPMHALIYALHSPLSHDRRTSSLSDPRLSLMSLLICLWGARLTFNAARKGYYNPGFVDYRYTWLRRHILPNPILFRLAYAILICAFMTILLALASSPLYIAWLFRGTSLNFLDILATIFTLSFILLETLADNQQAAFQARKRHWNALTPLQREQCARKGHVWEEQSGFVQTGLFAWSRHPNFFAEISIWASLYLFSVAASGLWVNWTMTGVILYAALFQITTPLTERISTAKYAAYKDYRRRVSRLMLSPFSRPLPMGTEGKGD